MLLIKMLQRYVFSVYVVRASALKVRMFKHVFYLQSILYAQKCFVDVYLVAFVLNIERV